MPRKCQVANKKPMSGNKVSHANNKTKRRFLPNIKKASFYSQKLEKTFKFKLSTKAIKTIDFKGGLDSFLEGAKDGNLPKEMLRIKKLIASK